MARELNSIDNWEVSLEADPSPGDDSVNTLTAISEKPFGRDPGKLCSDS